MKPLKDLLQEAKWGETQNFEGVVTSWESSNSDYATNLFFWLADSTLTYCLLPESTTNYERYSSYVIGAPSLPVKVSVYEETMAVGKLTIALVRRVAQIPSLGAISILFSVEGGSEIDMFSVDDDIVIPVAKLISSILSVKDKDKKALDRILNNVCNGCGNFAKSDDACSLCSKRICINCLKSKSHDCH